MLMISKKLEFDIDIPLLENVYFKKYVILKLSSYQPLKE